MQVNGKGGSLLQGGYQLSGRVRGQQAGHILDTQGISAHLLDFLSNILPVIHGVSIAQGIAQSNLSMALFLLGSLNGSLQIADVVEAVKDTDDVNTVCDGFLNKVLHHIVSIVVVAQNILSAEQHLQLGIFKAVSQFS